MEPVIREETPPVIVRQGEGHAHPGPYSNLIVKASSEATGGFYSLHEEVLQPGAGGPPVHTHRDQEEAFYVIDGELTMVLGEEVLVAAAGTFVLVPRGWRHGFANRTDSVVRMLGIFSPRGFDHGFEEIGALIVAGGSAEEVRALGEKHGVFMTGRPLGGRPGAAPPGV